MTKHWKPINRLKSLYRNGQESEKFPENSIKQNFTFSLSFKSFETVCVCFNDILTFAYVHKNQTNKKKLVLSNSDWWWPVSQFVFQFAISFRRFATFFCFLLGINNYCLWSAPGTRRSAHKNKYCDWLKTIENQNRFHMVVQWFMYVDELLFLCWKIILLFYRSIIFLCLKFLFAVIVAIVFVYILVVVFGSVSVLTFKNKQCWWRRHYNTISPNNSYFSGRKTTNRRLSWNEKKQQAKTDFYNGKVDSVFWLSLLFV